MPRRVILTKRSRCSREGVGHGCRKKADREASNGIIGNYVHMGAKMAALVEVNCETDFVARTEQFQALARDLAMQVVAARPLYVRREDVPAERSRPVKREEYLSQLDDANKPANVLERIIEGKLAKFYEETCLLEQSFIKDDSVTIQSLLTDIVARLGENIVVRRFARLELGNSFHVGLNEPAIPLREQTLRIARESLNRVTRFSEQGSFCHGQERAS